MTVIKEDSSLFFRVHSPIVIARRKISETWYSPGIYISLTAGLVIAFLIVTSYTKSIGSGGFDSTLNPFFNFLSGLLVGAFGEAFFTKVFSEGPFYCALILSFVPILVFITINSVFRFGFEKNVGALRLISFGPADGTSFIIGTLIKDIFFYVIALAVLICFFVLCAIINNLLLGPKFFFGILTIFAFALCVSAYGVFSSSVTGNSGAAVALFSAIMMASVAIHIGSFMKLEDQTDVLSSILLKIARWASPIFYWQQAMALVDDLMWGRVILALAGSGIMAIVLIGISHLVSRYREAD